MTSREHANTFKGRRVVVWLDSGAVYAGRLVSTTPDRLCLQPFAGLTRDGRRVAFLGGLDAARSIRLDRIKDLTP